jgi:putative endonuclease
MTEWGMREGVRLMRDHEYFVYIVSSRSGTIYIGMTNSIYRRALQHKRGEIEGFSSKYHLRPLGVLRKLR